MNRDFYIRVRGSDEYFYERVCSIYYTGRRSFTIGNVENKHYGSLCSISSELIKKLKVK